MSGFLDRLAARAAGAAPLVLPRVHSRFEGTGGLLAAVPPEAEAVPALPMPEDVAVARPVLDAAEGVKTAAAAPRVRREAPAAAARTPRAEEAPSPIPSRRPGEGEGLKRREEAPLSRADLGRLEPRPKGPFPLGGGGLEKGEGQDGGGLLQGNVDGGNVDSGRPRPVRLDPSDRSDRSDPSDQRQQLPAAREKSEGARLAAAPLPTLSPRGELPARLPDVADDAPSETVVRVHIGRIEVRAPQPPPARPPAAPRPAYAPRLGLADYLKRREERRR